MDKYLSEKINRYKTNLYMGYMGVLAAMVGAYTFYSVLLEINSIDGFKIFGTPVNKIDMLSMKSGWFILTATVVALVGIGGIYIYCKYIFKEITITYEDVIVPVYDNMLVLYNLLNKKVLIDSDNNLEINVENFPDSNVDILRTIDIMNSIEIRKYKFNGTRKNLKRLGLDDDKIYNYIVKINIIGC